MIETKGIAIERLSGGMKMVYVPMPGSGVEYAGVAVNAGSRNDPAGLEGMAHFVEHTIFKGTSRRRSLHIINRMEAVGGELNAYTTKETTVVYSIFPTGNYGRAAELIADLVSDSQFPDSELDKEREVVAEEISSYLDMPSEAVFDDFEDLLFAGSSLGHNILGTEQALGRMNSRACRNWLAENYTAERMTAFYAGPLPLDRALKTAERYFGSHRKAIETERIKEMIPAVEPFSITREIDNHQAHTVMGCRLPSMYSDDRYAIALLNNIIGGPGMNSQLNVALRERRGLVYSVDSSASLLTDTGIFAVYFGCDPADNQRCIRLVNQTLGQLADGGLTERQLQRAKRQYLGQLAVAAEQTENAVIGYARAALYRGEIIPEETIRQRILDLTVEDILRVARMIEPARLSRLTLG